MAVEMNPLGGLFTGPQPVGGKKPDRTGGRGHARSREDNFLERAIEAVERGMQVALTRIDAFADANIGVDAVRLTELERVERFLQFSTTDLEAMAGVFGPNAVQREREAVKNIIKAGGGG
jgi:hypothetical protein